jgi:two-component system, OmpR family, copper resistance phosphate regulon response regulator CusR
MQFLCKEKPQTFLMKILIIEDEPKVASFIKKGLEENNYSASIAYDGSSGLRMASEEDYDLIILDVNLPNVNGFEVCRNLRSKNSSIPILMLTALSSTEDKITGFDSGADDYLVKPFEFKELVARIKALAKRSLMSSSPGTVLRIADLEMNIETKLVKRAGKRIELTAKEFSLLEFLLKNKGKSISRASIAEKVWDITFDTGTNVIDVYVNFLRKKVDKDFSPKLIHTQIGMGYIIKED